MDKKSNILHSEQLLIGHSINDEIIEFINSGFNKIIIFTQKKIKKSYNKTLNRLININIKGKLFEVLKVTSENSDGDEWTTKAHPNIYIY